jgi:hypothetical protein
LGDLEEQALIAFYTMEHIRDLRLNSLSDGKENFTFQKEAIINKIM